MASNPAATSFEVELPRLRSWFGIGVAGNFAGHLEQAGEASDFVGVAAAAGAPKGLFPFYAPGHGSFLGGFPLSHDTIALPADSDAGLQIEPEVALACDVSYGDDGRVAGLTPFAFGAFNDCSIRRPGARKISEKKNWGPASKGVAARFVALDGADLAEATASWRLASFLRRDGELHAYGVDSPLAGYSYFGDRLLDWIVDRLANQHGSADTPLEPVGDYMRDCGLPEQALIAIGATRYTPFGESTYLQPGDESIVAVYDADRAAGEQVARVLAAGDQAALDGASILVQRVAKD
jgi:hypothetical protein